MPRPLSRYTIEMHWLMTCFAILSSALATTTSFAATLSETYEIRIAGIISTPERTQLQGAIVPVDSSLTLTDSVNQCSPASQTKLTLKMKSSAFLNPLPPHNHPKFRSAA